MARSTKETNERKKLILAKLNEAMGYCNSHHDPVQERFERVVDTLVAKTPGIQDPGSRQAEMKCLFPVLLSSEMHGYVPSITLNDSQLCLESAAYLDCWLTKWVKKYLAA